jgi:hypothetical protein
MLRNRLLMVMGVCLLAASGAWADDVGFVDCSKNADATQVFGKPRKTPDVVASLSCGERFTILVYGFYFSRIQTKDGQVGYIFSSLIVQDRGATSLEPAASAQPTAQSKGQTKGQQAGQQTPSLQVASEKIKIPRSTPFDAEPVATLATQPAAANAAQTGAAEEAAPRAAAADRTTGPVQGAVTAADTQAPSSAAVERQPVTPETAADQASAQPSSTQPAVTTASLLPTPPTAPSTPDADAAETAGSAAQPAVNAAADPQPAAAQPPAQPEPPAAAPAQPATIQPATPSIRPVDTRDRWERPQPSGRQAPLLEVFGGFALGRMGGGGTSSNLIGGLGSIGWNANSWLQVSADTSYNLVTDGTTKTVLYGNHYGPRFYYRRRNRWNITPFGEALIGGSDERTTVSGSGGSVTSTGSQISYKLGGGLDMRPTRRWEIRLFDVDYYRTAFGTDAHQTNYWISAGVVLRLFGGGNE